MTGVVEVAVLGPTQLIVDGRMLPLGGTKQRALIAVLGIGRGRAIASTSIASGLWNDEPPPNYPASVQVFVSNIRKQLRLAGCDPTAVLATAPPGYRLIVGPDGSDLSRFERSRDDARRAESAGRLEAALGLYREALAQWSGEALADLWDLRFADEFRAAMSEEFLAVTTSRIGVEIALGSPSAVVPELYDLTIKHPLREPIWAQLITALYLSGRQSDALAACRRLRKTLGDELGIDPSPALAELEGRVLRQERIDAPRSAVTDMERTVTDSGSGGRVVRLVDEGGRHTTVPDGGVRFGRHPDNDVVLDDVRVSRFHALVVDIGDTVVVRDLHSSNGTFLSGRRVVDSGVVGHGDHIRIGSSVWTVEIPDEAQ